MKFPDGFLWGTATAAHQVEGGNINCDGWLLEHLPDTRFTEPSADACDHYHRYGEDIALLKRLGAGAYRLSLSWPRIQPDGRGAVNAKGIDYYNRVIDGLLEAGIQPAVTLYHWDLPQALRTRAGGRTGTSRTGSRSSRASRPRRSATGCQGGSR